MSLGEIKAAPDAGLPSTDLARALRGLGLRRGSMFLLLGRRNIVGTAGDCSYSCVWRL